MKNLLVGLLYVFAIGFVASAMLKSPDSAGACAIAFLAWLFALASMDLKA